MHFEANGWRGGERSSNTWRRGSSRASEDTIWGGAEAEGPTACDPTTAGAREDYATKRDAATPAAAAEGCSGRGRWVHMNALEPLWCFLDLKASPRTLYEESRFRGWSYEVYMICPSHRRVYLTWGYAIWSPFRVILSGLSSVPIEILYIRVTRER